MHLIVLTQYYPPEVGAPQTRLSELAQLIVRSGHTVTVLTAMPNYPAGRIHQGYGGLLKRERREGANVIRTFIYPTQKATLVHRLTNYLSFVLSSALFGSLLLKRADYLLVESPPLFLGLSGLWLSRLKHARMIFNVSDLWPESAVRLGVLRPGSMTFRLSAWLEAICYRYAWLVTGQARTILESIRERFPRCRTFLLSNGVDTHRFVPDDRNHRSEAAQDGIVGCTVMYVGLHGLAQGLDQVLQAAKKLVNEHGFRFVLIGDGPEKDSLVTQAKELSLTNVQFFAPRPSHAVPALLATADVILVTLKMFIPGAVPSKLYEAMASERPVILVACGEAADIVREHKAGIVVEPGDIDGLAAALRMLRDSPDMRREMGRNGRKASETCFERTKIVASLREYLEANL